MKLNSTEREIIALKAYIRKEEEFPINNLCSHRETRKIRQE